MNEAEIAVSGLVVAGCQAAGAFQLVEAALHSVSEGVGDGIDRNSLFPVDLAGDDGSATTPCDHRADVIAVIATVGNEHPGFRQVLIDQCIEAFEVGNFAAAYLRPDRQSVSVGNEVDLGREATF